MTQVQVLTLVGLFLPASIITVIAGSTSLITVPLLLVFGIAPRTAIATNMLALLLMSVGASLPFLGKQIIDTQRLPLLIGLTSIGSVFGAWLVLIVSIQSMPLIISMLMAVVTLFSVSYQHAELTSPVPPSATAAISGYIATFILGIYGGFFSGGYVTLLTAAYVMLFRMTFVQAIATTKLINIFSSLIATLIFASQGIVDYRLGLILGGTMFGGGIIGGQLSLKLNNIWLQRIYLAVVTLLLCLTLRQALKKITP